MKIKLKKDEAPRKKKLGARTKLIITFSIMLIVVVGFFAFYYYLATRNTAISDRKMKKLMKDYPEIKMEVTDVTSDSLTLIVSKTVDVDLITTESIFTLYQKELGGWNPINVINASATDDKIEGSYTVTISGTGSQEIKLNVKERFGSLPKGEYVIRKTFSVSSDNNYGEGMLVYRKFEVK